MFLVQCEELRSTHRTPLLVVTPPYACWFLWWADYIEDFKWRLRFQFRIAFWSVVLIEVYFEGPNRIWRALKTPILNIASLPLKFTVWGSGARVRETFELKICPFTTSTGIFKIWPVVNLLPLIWTGQYPSSFQVLANFFFIVMTTSQELGHW